MIADILFYVFASILLLGALGVVTAKNAMHCVLFMILTFFNAAGLFILLGAEFLGLLLIMVYVGAIAVMFLFVVMTVNVEFASKEEGFVKHLPVGLFVALVLLAELVFTAWNGMFGASGTTLSSLPLSEKENIVQFGDVLFTSYVFPFILASLILLVAMVGAIVLAHRKREDVLRQNVPNQIARTRDEAVELVSVKTGSGIK